MTRLVGISFIAATALFLSACGGGGGDADAHPHFDSAPHADAPPQIDAMPDIDAAPACTAVVLGTQSFAGANPGNLAWDATVTTDLGDGGPSTFQAEFYDGIRPDPPGLVGTFDLHDAIDGNYSTCASCMRLFATSDVGGTMLTRQFFQRSGSLTLTESPFTNTHMLGTLNGTILEEVTVDSTTFVSTPVVGGECLTLEDPLALDSDSVPAAWTCPHAQYNDGVNCDCMCGTGDPDCAIAGAPLNGCTAGQVCSADGLCLDPPPNDTCATAITLTLGTPVMGTTAGATDDTNAGLEGATCTGFMQPGPDVHYKVVLGLNQPITVTLSMADPSYDGAIALTKQGGVAVCNAEPVVCRAGSDSGLAGDDETFSWTANHPAGTYWIVVDSYDPGVSGAFTLTATSP